MYFVRIKIVFFLALNLTNYVSFACSNLFSWYNNMIFNVSISFLLYVCNVCEWPCLVLLVSMKRTDYVTLGYGGLVKLVLYKNENCSVHG